MAGRIGRSAWEATLWVSDTSLVCSVGGGLGGSLALSVSFGLGVGTSSHGASYDAWGVSGVSRTNVVKSGSVSMTLSGGGFGSRR